MRVIRGVYDIVKHDAALKAFEEKYGVPSDRLCDAFRRDDGHLEETPDFLRWSALWSVEQRRRR